MNNEQLSKSAQQAYVKHKRIFRIINNKLKSGRLKVKNNTFDIPLKFMTWDRK
jgi:hypothetical protein